MWFNFSLLPYEGRVTAIHPPLRLGQPPTVELETDEAITDIDWSQAQDGRHVWVERDAILEKLSS